MNDFFSWLICCLAALIFFCLLLPVASTVANAAPQITRAIDNRLILLNTTKCDNSLTTYKAFKVENNVVHAGCWHNDGASVVTIINGVVTKYEKKLFELGIK